jgi:hypothetical protein
MGKRLPNPRLVKIHRNYTINNVFQSYREL